jgi:hypothetical protein
MSRWNFVINVIAWAFLITAVSPYPAVPEDNFFYTDDSTISESLSISSGSLTPSSPIPYENDGIGTGASSGPGLGDMGHPSDELMDTGLWEGYDEIHLPTLGVPSEPVGLDLTSTDNLVAVDPSDCPPDTSKHDKSIRLALGK